MGPTAVNELILLFMFMFASPNGRMIPEVYGFSLNNGIREPVAEAYGYFTS
jgi:hypothetical protein